MKITIAGARPNYMKIALILKAIMEQISLGKHIIRCLVHSGQHFNTKMSGDFIEQFVIPDPNTNHVLRRIAALNMAGYFCSIQYSCSTIQ